MSRRDLQSDLLLSGLGFAGLVVVLFFVFSGLEAPHAAPEGVDRVGTAEQVSDVARRRTTGTLVWNDLQRGREVYDGDAVFVGPGSAATIRLNDASTLEIAENTLVVMSAERGDTTVDVKKGSVGGYGPMVVRGGGGSVVLGADTRGRILVDGSGSTDIEISEGHAKLKTTDGKDAELDAGHALHMDSEGSRTITRMDIQLSEPASAWTIFIPSDQAQADFRWVAPENGSEFTLQLAANPRFRDVMRSVRTAETHAAMHLSPGVYYWHVMRGDSRSETRRLTVMRDDPPILYRPRAEQEYSLDERPAMAWTRVGGATDYELLIEKKYGGGEARTVVEGQTWYRAEVSPGAWCARVRTKRKGPANTPWSERRCFLVMGESRLPPPNLHQPQLHPTNGD